MISSAFCLSIARLVCSFSRGIESFDAPFLNLDLVAASDLLNLPIAQINHAIRHPQHLVIVRVGHNGHTAFALHLEQQFDDFLPGFQIQVSGWLIGQNQIWVIGHGPGDSHALLLTARQFVGLVMQAVAEAHQRQFVRGLSSYSLRDMPENTMGKATFSSAVMTGIKLND